MSKDRKIPKTVKFDPEIHELWDYLKSVKISPASLIHDPIKEILRQKAAEMKYKPTEPILPF